MLRSAITCDEGRTEKKSLNNIKDELAEAVGMSLVFMSESLNVKVKEMGCMDFRNYNDKFEFDKLVIDFRQKFNRSRKRQMLKTLPKCLKIVL